MVNGQCKAIGVIKMKQWFNVTRILVVMCYVVLFAKGVWASEEQELEYKLRAGDWLKYERTYFDGCGSETEAIHYLVLGGDKKVGWNVIVVLEDERDVKFGSGVLQKDGKFDVKGKTTNPILFRAFFPRLSDKKKWDYVIDPKGEVLEFHIVNDGCKEKVGAKIFGLSGEVTNKHGKEYGLSVKCQWDYNPMFGLMEKVEQSKKCKRSKTKKQYELVWKRRIKESRRKVMEEDYQAIEALKFQFYYRDVQIESKEELGAYFDGVVKNANALVGKLKDSQFEKWYEKVYATLICDVESERERESKRVEMRGKLLREWELKDLEGNQHKSSDYLGKVVIYDFWATWCGWCIEAMPTIMKIASEFEGQDVVVIGMNSDRNVKDAKRLEKKMKINYVSMQTKGFENRIGVTAFPTFLVVDKEGFVWKSYAGFSKDLHKNITQDVKFLLKRNCGEKKAEE